MQSLRQEIKFLVNRFIRASEKAKQISFEGVETEKIDNLRDAITKEVENLINNLKRFQNLEWDTLNIAFFGETNAGKSTLIEALIKGDGRTVGTGVKDFTTEIKNYSFGEKIKLLDMPGIEGDEKKVKNEIWKAVNKAHIIFYIFPHTKEPERETLKKIRKYLNKNAYVYGLINIRGNLPKQALEKILNENIKIVKENSERHLKEYLKDAFKDIFIVHTLYAFFSRARQIPDNLKNSYEKALNIYQSKEELEELSKIKKIEEIVKKENQKKEIIIPWDNTKKILKSQEQVISQILYFKKDMDKAIKDFKDHLYATKEKLKKEKELLKSNINRVINVELSKFESELIEFLYTAIDEEYEKSFIQNKIKSMQDDFIKKVNEEIKKEIKSYSDNINKSIELSLEKIRKLKKSLEFFFKKQTRYKGIDGNFYINLNMEKILNELELKGEEIISEFGSIATKFIAMRLTASLSPILGIVNGIIFSIEKIWDWFVSRPEKKRSKARNQAKKEVKKTVKNLQRKISFEIKKVIKEKEEEIRQVFREFDKVKYDFKKLLDFLQIIINDLKDINYQTSETFLKFLDENIKFGFIQVSLKEGVSVIAVCNPCNALLEKLEMLGIKKENIFIFYSLLEMKNYIDLNKEKSELFKRVADIKLY